MKTGIVIVSLISLSTIIYLKINKYDLVREQYIKGYMSSTKLFDK